MQQLKNNPNIQEFLARIQAIPQPATEESILLRILVQMMVIVGIIATDVASQAMNPMSIWAIPLSILGGVVSWRRRKKKNIAIKFALAMGMIIVLVIFLGNLFQSLNDTRLVLAEFLVQLQVLHSFDLPRRKDLGYSMIIGLILIGVSATLSQTLAFAPWLLVMLLLAIPTLVLDYRSRMGLAVWEENWQQLRREKNPLRQKQLWQNSPLSPQKLLSFSLIVLVLGLFIFAVMPRYPSYQIQSFPVSAPEGFENQNFQGGNRSIVNPGYNPDGTLRNEMTGEGGGATADETGYYGFNKKINQNINNTITERKILLRIRSQAPGFWRVLAFDRYTGQGWEIAREEETSNISRNFWNYYFSLPLPPMETETRKIIQTYTVVHDIPNIIPALSYPQSLYFPSTEIAFDTEGSMRSPGGLIEGLTYTVVSQVPYRSQSQLQLAGEEYPETIKKYYLDISPALKEKLKSKAEGLMAKAGRELPSNYDKALYLAQAVKQNYEVKTDNPLLGEGEDLITAFLANGGGFPDQFATVYTMMLRALDIPSRFVVGFDTGQFNPFTGYYVVHNTDAHALTEVYFPDYGWFAFNPLPGFEIIPPSFQDDNPFGVLGIFWKWIAGWLPPPITAFISALFSKITQIILGLFRAGWLSKLWQFLTGSLVGILMGILGLIIVAFLGWLGFNYLKQILYQRYLSRLNPTEKLYREMLDFLKEKGYPKYPYQTPREYAHNLGEILTLEQLEIVYLISDNYVQWRYGNLTPNLDYLTSEFRRLKRSFAQLSQVT